MKLLEKAKQMCNGLLKKSLACGKSALCFALEYTTALVVICAIAFVSLKLPELHNKYLHKAVGSKVYTIRESAQSGGGTGFAVKAPSGDSYILTNDHVCGVSKDGTVLVTGDDSSMRRRIIAHDENSDLCLIEGMPGIKGLSVADDAPSRGDTTWVVGHPRLLPTHVEKGELFGKEDVSFLQGIISVMNPDTGEEMPIDPSKGGMSAAQCSLNKNHIVMTEMNMFIFVIKIKVCITTVKDAYITSVVIHPGNSGSPVVNFWGSVEGVAFASDDTHWGRMVPLQDVKAFLKNY